MITPNQPAPRRFSRGCILAGLAIAPHAICLLHAAEPPAPGKIAHFEGAMPKPASLPDGTLAAYFIEHRGPGLNPTPDLQTFFARFSKDGGRTWGSPVTQFKLPTDQGFGFFVVQVAQDGEVQVLLLGDAATGVLRARRPESKRPAVEPLEKSRLDVWHVRSFDGRTRWSDPKRIWKGRAGDLQSVTQLASGRLVLPLSYLNPRSWRNRGEGAAVYTFRGQFDCTVLFSDDGGATWQQSSSVLQTPTPTITGTYGPVEPVAIQMERNRVWMLLRTQMGNFYESTSTDGAQWTAPVPSAFFSSDSPVGFARVPDGRVVMLWNNCLRFPYAMGSRRALHAAITSDNGKTWRGYREVLRDPARNEPPPPGGDHGVSYPFVTTSPDGAIIFSLWVENGTGRGLYRLSPDWLEQTRQTEDFVHGLDAWSVYGTRGAEVVGDRTAEDGRALRLQRTETDWETGAVWNFPAGQAGVLKARLKMENAGNGILLMLTDHFSSPFDLQDRFNSVYNLRLDAGNVQLPRNRWVELQLRWDNLAGHCQVTIDGRVVGSLPALRRTNGVSYLRLRATEVSSDGGLLLDSVHVEITPPTFFDPTSGNLMTGGRAKDQDPSSRE